MKTGQGGASASHESNEFNSYRPPHRAMPTTATGRQKRKLCLAETEQLYLAQDDLDVEHATKFRKMGTYHDAQRKRRARIQMLHNNAAH